MQYFINTSIASTVKIGPSHGSFIFVHFWVSGGGGGGHWKFRIQIIQWGGGGWLV